jgi:hypothetical protein
MTRIILNLDDSRQLGAASRPYASTRQGDLGMPMIDVYAAPGTFADKHALAQELACAVMRWEQVPDLAPKATRSPPAPTSRSLRDSTRTKPRR